MIETLVINTITVKILVCIFDISRIKFCVNALAIVTLVTPFAVLSYRDVDDTDQ